jgi:hypothetical protein
VAVFIQCLVDGQTVVGAERLAAEQGGQGAQRLPLPSPQDLIQIKEQILALSPLGAVDQIDKAPGEED